MKSPLAYVLIGGVAFWTPDILIPPTRRGATVDVIGVFPLTVLLPAVLVAVYFLIGRYATVDEPAPSVALLFGIGVWLLGPLSMMLAWTPVGAGFSTRSSPSGAGYMLLCSVFPPGTLLMSAYDGSVLALILASLLMLLMHFRFERGHWLM